ncbi:right-handed parallel beta-helix repeat-containing protein [Bacillus solimangrovi]|uniref:Right handed beta helix domain-containing protein n=1 Tax=Bacillus solimangrovi TaxID=1305675 RepID=A0A1E5LAK9_9BACI|nr:right-handed parallel beta-helix repeat-containing protein [Bacillus solimangrovi]OEH91137.1 hypothetical protein BFG57_07130 [Bacillus solimangrovi]
MTLRIVPTEFTTVQGAINASSAGDSIQILAGTFDGFNVDVERLKIFGCGIGKTIIAGNPSPVSTNGIDVNADQTILKELTVQGFETNGIAVLSNNNMLKQIESTLNGDDGVEINGNNNLVIDTITTFNRSNGLDIPSGQHNCILRNESQHNFQNGYLLAQLGAENNTLINNLSKENNSNGFFVNLSSSNILLENTSIKNNLGILVFQSSNIQIILNRICNNSRDGIRGSFTTESVIDSNIIRNNNEDGINLFNSVTDSIIRFNKAKGNAQFDIDAQGGVGTNIYDGNKCENSSPPGLCT